MDNSTELMEALSQITREKGIDKQIVLEAIETSLVSACKKNFGTNANIKVHIDEGTGKVRVVNQKDIVEDVEDESNQISLEHAREIRKDYEIGDVVEFEVAPKDFGRISAQTAKQVVVQRFREAERDILFDEYISKENEVITGTVQRRDRRNVIVNIGKLEGVIPPNEQIPREPYNFGDRIKVYVMEVKQTNKGPIVNVSRNNPGLVKKLFEQEVPEVFDGTVEIKSVAREPGIRSKVAVYSRNPHVDPVGACVGQSGYRVNVVSNELRGEKLDVIPWNMDPSKYIASALSPSKVNLVAINPYDTTAKVIVPDHQLSLAIGKEGQNARLAARLTGWRIDIKSESHAREIDFITDEELDVDYEAFLEEKAQLEDDARRKIEQSGQVEEVSDTAEASKPTEAAAEEYYDDDYDDDYDDGYDDDYDDDYYDDEYDDDYDDDYDDYDDGYDDYDDYDDEYEDEVNTSGESSAGESKSAESKAVEADSGEANATGDKVK